MVEVFNAQAIFLDHSYCKTAPLDLSFSSIWKSDLIKMADDMLDWKDSFGVEFDPPSVESNPTLSALSPSHSTDSGLDSEVNFLDLDHLDFDMLFADVKKEDPKPKNHKNASFTATTASKPVAEMTEAEKSRKNALAARENRIKKKKYLESIEKELGELRKENELLKAKDRLHNQVVEKLKQEVSYLKNVLANQSTLSVLMNRLVSTPGITFNLPTPEGIGAPNTSGSKDTTMEHNATVSINTSEQSQDRVSRQSRYMTRGTKRNASTSTETNAADSKKRKEVKGGVCLHVGQDMVSLTFCSQCSSNVNSSSTQ